MERLVVLSRSRPRKDEDPSAVLGNAVVYCNEKVEFGEIDKLRREEGPKRIDNPSVEDSVSVKYFAQRGGHAHSRHSSADLAEFHFTQQQQQRRAFEEDLTGTMGYNRRHQAENAALLFQMEEELARVRLAMDTRQDEADKLRDEVTRKNREITALTMHVETLNDHLQSARLADSQTFLHSRKDTVVETEGLKARLSKAERERDAVLIQVQELERRTKMERDEEAALREELTSRAAESERRAAYAELQRSRAEAEAGAARQQIEHWRSAARAAQDEVAALRAQVDTLRELVFRQSANPMVTGVLPSQFVAPLETTSAVTTHSPPDNEAAMALIRRQQKVIDSARMSNGDHRIQPSPMAQQHQQQAQNSFGDQQMAARKRLAEIAQELKRLDDAMEDMGPASGRTLQQRLQREQLRRQMDELSREAAGIRAQLGPQV